MLKTAIPKPIAAGTRTANRRVFKTLATASMFQIHPRMLEVVDVS